MRNGTKIIKCPNCKSEREVGEDIIMIVCKCGNSIEIEKEIV